MECPKNEEKCQQSKCCMDECLKYHGSYNFCELTLHIKISALYVMQSHRVVQNIALACDSGLRLDNQFKSQMSIHWYQPTKTELGKNGNKVYGKKLKQAEAEVVPSSSLVKIRIS